MKIIIRQALASAITTSGSPAIHSRTLDSTQVIQHTHRNYLILHNRNELFNF